MPRGKVKWFNNAKGYGFIIEDGCSDDLFAHFSSVQMDGYKTLKAGQPVTFDKKPSDKGVHAINIVPDAAYNCVRVIHPVLPESIDRLFISNLRVGSTVLDLEFERSGGTTACRVAKKRGNLKVVFEA